MNMPNLISARGRRADHRNALIEALRELRHEGKVTMTDASIRAAKTDLEKRARHWLALLAAHDDRKAQSFEDMPQLPSPRTLRSWLGTFCRNAHDAAIYRACAAHSLRSQSDPAYKELIVEAFERYLNAGRPSIAMIHKQLSGALDECSEERSARGLEPLAIPQKETFRRQLRREFPLRRAPTLGRRSQRAPCSRPGRQPGSSA